MPYHPLHAIFFVASFVLSTGATAQNIHKCGDTYSQLPCPDGAVIHATDPRSIEQKSQMDLATARDTRTANALESARLQQEKIDLANNTPPLKPVNADSASKGPTNTGSKKKIKKKKIPENFSAQTPREKSATKRTLKKTGARKESGNS